MTRQGRCRTTQREAPVTGLVWLNVPLVVLAFLAIVGIPMWLTYRRPERHPDYAGARAHFAAQERRGQISTEAARRSAPGLAAARQHATAAAAIPGRKHSGSGPGRRAHPAERSARSS
jgi:hypothetical protein